MIDYSGRDAFETGRGERARAWGLRLLTLVGLLASVYYFSWWSHGGRMWVVESIHVFEIPASGYR